MNANATHDGKGTDAEIIDAGDDAEIVDADNERQQDRLEAYQPLATGDTLELRGYGTPDDWTEEIQLVDEQHRRTTLFVASEGMAATRTYNALVSFVEAVGMDGEGDA